MPMTKALEGITARLQEQNNIMKEAYECAKRIGEEFADHADNLDKETSLAILKQIPRGLEAHAALCKHICLQFGITQNELIHLASGRKRQTLRGKGEQRCPTKHDKKS